MYYFPGVETNITLPIKDGVDVAVLIFPGAYLTVDQYEQLGKYGFDKPSVLRKNSSRSK